MTQGILLVGGFGTRLMPLTQSVPKPMLPVAGLPVTEHQIAAAKQAGITSLVLATSYLSEIFLPYFGDGSKWGINIFYAQERSPLGTGGAIRNAAQLLNGDEPIVIFNGDILSSHDLSAQIKMHEELDADVTLHLTKVLDARPYGCVPIDENGRVTAFLEKMENPVTNSINAGCYVFNPRVIKQIPAEQVVSIEREIFPALIADNKKIYGVIDDSYWLDIGTPLALLKGSRDLVEGRAKAEALTFAPPHLWTSDFLAMESSEIHSSAIVDGGSAIGRNVRIMSGAHVQGSIISDGVTIGAGAKVIGSFIAESSEVASGAEISESYLSRAGLFSLTPDANK